MHCLVLFSAIWLWSVGVVSCAEVDDFSHQLSYLIRAVRLPEERLQEIPRLLAHLEEVLGTVWPGCKVRPYGSYVYGLAMIHSDVDASVMLPHANVCYGRLVKEAHRALQQHPEFTNFRAITWVLVPVVSFEHTPTKFKVDISINAYREFQMSDLIKYLLSLDERIYNFMFIIKIWSKLNNITGSHVLANYGMNVLAIFYLQQRKMLPSIASLQKDAQPVVNYDWNYGFNKIEYEVRDNVSTNVLTGEFFEYYAKFDFEKYIISPYAGYPVERAAFENVDTVPDVFELYKVNVGNNITEPLMPFSKPVLVQDIFIHNNAVMSRQSPKSDSSFMRLLNFAAAKYGENKNNFLKKILSQDVIMFMKYVEDEPNSHMQN